MSDVRDPERDQPLPTAGQQPVQQILIQAIAERRDFGVRKYGRPLETHNGRDALKDVWEEMLDSLTYLTQLRLERGDDLGGAGDQEQAEAADGVPPLVGAARTVARNALVGRGFTDAEAVALLCPVIGEAYREAAREVAVAPDDCGCGGCASCQLWRAAQDIHAMAHDIDPQHHNAGQSGDTAKQGALAAEAPGAQPGSVQRDPRADDPAYDRITGYRTWAEVEADPPKFTGVLAIPHADTTEA